MLAGLSHATPYTLHRLLRELDLSFNHLTDAGIKHVAPALETLRHLDTLLLHVNRYPSLIRINHPLGPYSRTMPRALRWF